MGNVFLIVRVGLAGVFVAAAMGKLASLERTRESLAGFDVPDALLVPASVALILAELAIAVLLVPPATAVAAAAAAALLMVVFSVAIARAIARGERPDCNCFGQLHSRPVGWGTVARNLLIGGLAVAIAVGGPGESIGQALAGVDPLAAVAVGVLIVVLVGLIWFTCELFRQNGRLLERIQALEEGGGRAQTLDVKRSPLPVGSPAPWFALPDLDGTSRSLDDLLQRGRPLVLAFVDPDCGACWSLVPRLARLRAEQAGELELAVVSRGAAVQTRRHLNGHQLGPVLMQQDREVAEAYRVNGVPSVVLVAPDGRMASQVAIGELAVERLIGPRDGTAKSTANGNVG